MNWPPEPAAMSAITAVVVLLILFAVIVIPVATSLTRSLAGTAASSEPRRWPTLTESHFWKLPLFPVWAAICFMLLLLGMSGVGCVYKHVFVPVVIGRQIEKEPDNEVPKYNFDDSNPAPAVTSVATTPVSLSPPPPADYRQEWVRLMEGRIDDQHRTTVSALAEEGLPLPQFWPQNLEPVSSITLQPGDPPRFTGQVLDGGQKSHVWLNYFGNRKEVELCGTVHQSKWFVPRANPSRVFSEPGADVLLVRLKPGVTAPMTITAERVIRDEQRDRTDLTMRPAVRKIYRNVPGHTKVGVSGMVLTALPSGQRVDCTVMILLLYGDGLALNPTDSTGSLSVDFGTGSQTSDLKFEATTVGKTNPRLFVEPKHPGVYDIVVVLTPL